MHLFEPLNLGTSVLILPQESDVKAKGDLIVLVGGKSVARLGRENGEIKWRWEDELSG